MRCAMWGAVRLPDKADYAVTGSFGPKTMSEMEPPAGTMG